MDAEPSPKRRRVALACTSCRERKVRCDGTKPVCTACQKRGSTACVYQVISSTAKYQSERAYTQSLQSYVQNIERQAQMSDDTRPNAPADTVSPINAMGTAIPMMDHVSSTADQFYGQSSVVSLIQQVVPTRKTARHSSGSILATPKENSSLLDETFSLPPRRAADWLLDIYFHNVHVFYPWVHTHSFMKAYESLWTNQDTSTNNIPDIGLGGSNCPSSVFSCALNAIFALACEFSNLDFTEKTRLSALFYDRIKGLLHIDLLDSGSLCHVQALLLVAQYLQCTQYPTRCWNIVGLAYRMSLGLGLHSMGNAQEMSAIETQIRRRVWHGCIQMDITVSMTMGRPPTAPRYNVPLPDTIDDEFLIVGMNDCRQPEEIFSQTTSYLENLKLIDILGKILLNVYHGDKSDRGSNGSVRDLEAILQLDSELASFEKALHPNLDWNNRDHIESKLLFKRQSNVLQARFLHLKLLLYRPTFSLFCSRDKTETTSDLPRIHQKNCAVLCVQAACNLIESLERATAVDSTGVWWYGVFYLVTAGIILVLADSDESLIASFSKEQLETAWGNCLQALFRMAQGHSSARDYAIALGALKQRAGSQRINASQSRAPSRARSQQGIDDQVSETTNPPDLVDENDLRIANIETDGSPHDIFSPLLQNWETGIEDIMLPAHLLQDIDEGFSLPHLF
ncbi:hypothetical protein AWENTII_011836 [Aspergillus wentii]